MTTTQASPHPANPLRQALDRLERAGIQAPAARLFEATGRTLMPSTIAKLCRPIPQSARSNEPRPAIPRPETRARLHEALLKVAPDSGGLPAEAWDAFAAALHEQRARFDRRRNDVRRRLRLPPRKKSA